MTEGDWTGDVQDLRSYSCTTVWVNGSTEDTWYPVCASSVKHDKDCLSSGHSELMAHGGWRVRRNRHARSVEQIVWMFCWNCCLKHTHSSPELGFCETQRTESSYTVRGHKDLLHASLDNGTWTKVHCDSQQLADGPTQFMTPQASHRHAMGLWRGERREVGAKWHFPPIIASDIKLTWTPR